MALDKIKSSNGFVTSPKKQNEITSDTRTSNRTKQPRVKFEPDFASTYKRKQATLSALEIHENETDMDSDLLNFDQLMSCMEKNVKSEIGLMKTEDQNEIHNNLMELDSPDPKSQAAIDAMTEARKKRYNDATKREYEGMKNKKVMENVRMSDVPEGSKLYICVVNWVTKFVLGTYSKTKCRVCFGGHHYVKSFTDCFAPTVNFCNVLIDNAMSSRYVWLVHRQLGLFTGILKC